MDPTDFKFNGRHRRSWILQFVVGGVPSMMFLASFRRRGDVNYSGNID